jgi:hypothetical protein
MRALNIMKDILSTYYKCAFSTMIKKLNISGHILKWTFFFCLDIWNSCPKFFRTFRLHPLLYYIIYHFPQSSCCICTYWSRRLLLPTRGLGTASPLRFSNDFKLVLPRKHRFDIAACAYRMITEPLSSFYFYKLSSLLRLISYICWIFLLYLFYERYFTYKVCN